MSKTYTGITGLDKYISNLDTALFKTMQSVMPKKVTKAIQESIDENVYSVPTAFKPWGVTVSRRPDLVQSGVLSGKNAARRLKTRSFAGVGIQNEKSFTHKVERTSTATQISARITTTDDAPWQNILGGSPPAGSLAETVEKVGMYGKGPRPFMEKAEDDSKYNYIDAIVLGLEKRGF